MSKHHTGHYVEGNGIHLHYLDYGGDGHALLMLHSLSANAHVFQGLIANGLAQNFRVIIPDLRGRGLSDKPAFDYSLESEAKDLEHLLDTLGIEKVIVCGHSFGELLGTFFAAHYPTRVQQLIIVDAAVALNPLTPYLISYSVIRLMRGYTSWQEFLTVVRSAPFMTAWDAAMLPFLKVDVIEQSDGTILPRPSIFDITKAAAHLLSIPASYWRQTFSSVYQPSLLIQASEPFVHGQFIVEEDKAIQTLTLMPNCDHLKVEGNHVTMLFAHGAMQIVRAIKDFCKVTEPEAVEALG